MVMYFIGVTTKQSSIMKLFPYWMEILGIKSEIKGIDIEIHAQPSAYREVVEFIKNDKESAGALVTTHKIDLFNAAGDIFDYLDPYAQMFGELSSISKKDGRLEGYAKDPLTVGMAMDSFLADYDNYWEHGGDVLIFGAGGSAISAGAYILNKYKGATCKPKRLIVCNRSKPRLIHCRELFDKIKKSNNDYDIATEYYLTPEFADNDRVLSCIKPKSLIINATGLGKDRPGSPLSDDCIFPEESIVWEFNYRGDLGFMHQAMAQREQSKLRIEDGWVYFLHGWTQVIAEVFHIEITPEQFAQIAEVSRSIKERS